MTAANRIETEVKCLKCAQENNFPSEVAALQAGKPLTAVRFLSVQSMIILWA